MMEVSANPYCKMLCVHVHFGVEEERGLHHYAEHPKGRRPKYKVKCLPGPGKSHACMAVRKSSVC